jgi:hypothetical protein
MNMGLAEAEKNWQQLQKAAAYGSMVDGSVMPAGPNV